MNQDARYVFCMAGFVGFILFFVTGWFLTGNALDALLRGCVACLVFAWSGRFLLGMLLRAVEENLAPVAEANLEVDPEMSEPEPSDPEKIASEATAEAAVETHA